VLTVGDKPLTDLLASGIEVFEDDVLQKSIGSSTCR
jgi:hypothetical protein